MTARKIPMPLRLNTKGTRTAKGLFKAKDMPVTVHSDRSQPKKQKHPLKFHMPNPRESCKVMRAGAPQVLFLSTPKRPRCIKVGKG